MITVRAVRYDAEVSIALTAAALAELSRRYGGPGDSTPVSAEEFAPPHGDFLIAYVDGEPAGCGGWRTHPDDPEVAEIKRMYTEPRFQRRGVARAILTAAEESALAAGRRRMILETGLAQPEAIAFYQRCGYQRIADFGYYRDYPDVRSFGRDLRPA
jgi:GNAT superfamily N-acetyltransferase